MTKYLLGLVVVTVLIFVAYINSKGKLIKSPATKNVVVSMADSAKIDKTDPKWLEKYCREEVKKLPPTPFKHRGLDGDVHMLSIPDSFLKREIPEEKYFQTKVCSLWYRYDLKEAYASLGVEYTPDIRATNAFEENADRVFSAAIDKSWKKISPLSGKESGRPNYGYVGFPLVFNRENKDANTVDLVTVTFGANNLFVNFITYEK